jgi:hypothetical protein
MSVLFIFGIAIGMALSWGAIILTSSAYDALQWAGIFLLSIGTLSLFFTLTLSVLSLKPPFKNLITDKTNNQSEKDNAN